MSVQRLKVALVVAATLVLAVLVLRHADGLNGPSYWRWPWKKTTGIAPYFLLFAAFVPLLLAVIFFDGRTGGRGNALPGLLLMMSSVLAMQLALRLAESPSKVPYSRIIQIIEEPEATGYFNHAEDLVQSGRPLREWLADFPDALKTYSLHARNKPPGSILFYVFFFHVTSTEVDAALAAGLTIALLVTLSVPATWFLIREFTGDSTAAYRGAAFMSATPGLILFFPEFDQFYPLYTAALLILWMRSLKTNGIFHPILLGLLFAFVCFQTFNLLVLGIFVIGAAVLSRQPRLAIRQAAIAAGTVVAAYGIFWLATGYNPIATLRTGIYLHNLDMPATHRHWPNTIPFDLTDFALGTGWISVLLAAMCWNTRHRPIVLLCLLQIVAVAIAGVLQGETARVWIFLFPLLMVPVGLELARWPRSMVPVVLICLWVLTAVLSQNMIFVY